MDKISIQLPDGRISCIYIGKYIRHILQYTVGRKMIILTEQKIYELYKQEFPANVPVVRVEGGEANKTLATIGEITGQLIENGIDRESFIVGIGGGIVCDITGFVASIYMRGLRFGFVPTTLLAQVDAGLGGKNGINFAGYKNMLGVFNQPDFVLCDTSALGTLPARELHAGLAEVVKTALIADNDLFVYLEENVDRILNLDEAVVNHLVKRCVEIKASIVKADEREAGERRKLNLGHTFGHAIEKHSNLLHGEAISIGLCIAARISQKLNLLTENDVQRIDNLLITLKLPVKTAVDKALLLDTITKDKKKQNRYIHFILNDGIGKAKTKLLGFDELGQLVNGISYNL
ncbi:MAG: 3-dehydroquinate synthase [Prevotellaceae bacterium]|jgi:3-dehydroquinate synthase|nr:3-dehydroquinate synthase [Prevotellaceae bacterium]